MIFTKAQVAGVAAALSMCAAPAWATYCSNGGTWPECKPPTTTPPPPANPTTISGTSTASSDSTSNATAGAAAGAVGSGVGTGYGGSATSSLGPVSASVGSVGGGSASGGSSAISDSSRYGMYVFPAPVSLPPLPAYFCPKGDSLAWSIGWNFFSYSKSSTRTELECLERVLEIVKANSPPVAHEMRLQAMPGERLHPVCTAVKPKRTGAKPKKVCK